MKCCDSCMYHSQQGRCRNPESEHSGRLMAIDEVCDKHDEVKFAEESDDCQSATL